MIPFWYSFGVVVWTTAVLKRKKKSSSDLPPGLPLLPLPAPQLPNHSPPSARPVTPPNPHLIARKGDGRLKEGPCHHLVAKGRGQRALVTEEEVPVLLLGQEGIEGYVVVRVEFGSWGEERRAQLNYTKIRKSVQVILIYFIYLIYLSIYLSNLNCLFNSVI